MTRSLLCLLGFAVTFTLAEEPAKKDTDPLDGKVFLSKKKLESGRTPDGIALDHWRITFRGGQMSWRYSDVIEQGRYTIDADGIFSVKFFNRTAKGKYDAKAKELKWQDQDYVLDEKK